MSSPVSACEKRLVRETPAEYWPNLLQLIRLFRESVTLKPAEASFRQGWQEAVNGQTPLLDISRFLQVLKPQVVEHLFRPRGKSFTPNPSCDIL